MRKPTLLVLAAGMGSRYGGLKQIEKLGPSGETILDYSVYDAVKCGFGKVVFVIRRQFENDFKDVFGKKFGNKIDVEFVNQELDELPDGFELPAGRLKPWGTGHAVWIASDVINEPFAVINADDFYGQKSFEVVADYLKKVDKDKPQGALVGYKLSNTLSEHGSVSRGVCTTDEKGNIAGITERKNIFKDDKGVWYKENEELHPLNGDETVSMNFFGFTPAVFKYFEKLFVEFLENRIEDEKAEFYLPYVANYMIKNNIGDVKRLSTPERWFGVTYPDDKTHVVSKLKELVETGTYPSELH